MLEMVPIVIDSNYAVLSHRKIMDLHNQNPFDHQCHNYTTYFHFLWYKKIMRGHKLTTDDHNQILALLTVIDNATWMAVRSWSL